MALFRIFILMLYSSLALGLVSDITEHQFKNLQKKSPPSSLTDRIVFFSALFLDKPYIFHSLGEGPQGEFDQASLYRFDGFDCLTYVETVLALSFSSQPQSFKQCLNQIRYEKGRVQFLNRNHFTSLDWNPHNQQRGFIKDITASIHDSTHRTVVRYARAFIDKPAWYKHLPLSIIRLFPPSPKIQVIKHAKLKQEGSKIKGSIAEIPYIPLTILFNKQQQVNQFILQQIPQGAIIEIVRPNWNLKKEIGTHLNVSHLGFAIWKDNRLWFREASVTEKKVIDILLEDYLRDTLKSPTIRGINIQMAQQLHDPC